jgi:beta-lactamase superfamily II metal-dependent hydrolase
MKPHCEVHFLDVGQGSCSVIRFTNPRTGLREAVLIDSGRSSTIPLDVLEEFVDYVPAWIITHNHADHIGGLRSILQHENWGRRKGKVGTIYLVNDKSRQERSRGAQKFGEFLVEEEKDPAMKYATAPLTLGTVYSVLIGGHRLSVDALAPSVGVNFASGSANATSAVVELNYAKHRVLFCGDSSSEVWSSIRARRDRLEYEAVTVPHHGGKMPDEREGGSYAPTFFGQAVRAKHAVLSYCASNGYGHPRSEVVLAARGDGSGATILCTQLHPELNHPPYDRPGVVTPTHFSLSGRHPGLSKSKFHKDRRIHFACAGSITLSLSPEEAHWGKGADPNPICGFRTLEEFHEAVARLPNHRGCKVPCH